MQESQELQELSEEQLQAEVNKIYTPLSVAKEEIWRRWNDKALRKKVEDFLGVNLPEPFKNEPRAVMLRYIATPNFEASFFIGWINFWFLHLHSLLFPIFVIR